MKTWLTTVLACTGMALILGCNDSSADPAAPAVPASLQGTAWKLSAWSASSLDSAHFTITAAFADGQISGRSAVNSYGGPYSANVDGTFATGPLAMTEMAGEPAAMRAESLYHSLLAQANRWRRDGSQLVLSAGAQDLLIFDPQ